MGHLLASCLIQSGQRFLVGVTVDMRVLVTAFHKYVAIKLFVSTDNRDIHIGLWLIKWYKCEVTPDHAA